MVVEEPPQLIVRVGNTGRRRIKWQVRPHLCTEEAEEHRPPRMERSRRRAVEQQPHDPPNQPLEPICRARTPGAGTGLPPCRPRCGLPRCSAPASPSARTCLGCKVVEQMEDCRRTGAHIVPRIEDFEGAFAHRFALRESAFQSSLSRGRRCPVAYPEPSTRHRQPRSRARCSPYRPAKTARPQLNHLGHGDAKVLLMRRQDKDFARVERAPFYIAVQHPRPVYAVGQPGLREDRLQVGAPALADPAQPSPSAVLGSAAAYFTNASISISQPFLRWIRPRNRMNRRPRSSG